MSDSNPYQPPAAPAAAYSAAGRAVDAGRGWEWIVAGWALFTRQPGPWIGIAFAWGLFAIVANFIPPLAMVNIIVGPALLGGLMLGAHALQTGGAFGFNYLFAGFRKNAGALLCVGLVYFVSLTVITLIAGLVTGFGVIKAIFAAMTAADLMQNTGAVIALIMQSLTSILLGLLVALALLVPVAMMLWFAPALIVFHNAGVIAALRASFTACLKNFVPFLVYGIVLLVPFMAATMLFGLGWLIVGPLIVTSTYAAYRDIFVAG
jgi:uncharacterized membrane protein